MGTHPIFESDFDCLTEIGMTLKDGLELVRRLMRFGPLMAMATIGVVWCGGLISLIT